MFQIGIIEGKRNKLKKGEEGKLPKEYTCMSQHARRDNIKERNIKDKGGTAWLGEEEQRGSKDKVLNVLNDKGERSGHTKRKYGR